MQAPAATGGILGRIRAAGRRIASVTAAASSVLRSAGSASTQSAFTLFRSPRSKSTRVAPEVAPEASGPVAEAAEEEAPVVLSSDAWAADAPHPQLRRRRGPSRRSGCCSSSGS